MLGCGFLGSVDQWQNWFLHPRTVGSPNKNEKKKLKGGYPYIIIDSTVNFTSQIMVHILICKRNLFTVYVLLTPELKEKRKMQSRAKLCNKSLSLLPSSSGRNISCLLLFGHLSVLSESVFLILSFAQVTHGDLQRGADRHSRGFLIL